MVRNEGWGPNRPGEITVNEDLEFSPEEVEARRFKIEPIEYKGRTIKLVSIESQIQYTKDRTDFVPADWAGQVAEAMRDTAMVFVTYFPPELENTAYSSRLTGARARSWGEQMLHGVYQTVADLAAEQDKLVGVCDIANKAAYLLYERNFPNRVPYNMQVSAYGVEVSKSEQYFPQTVDARRMFTARGIAQAVEEYPEGSSFMYVAAPAHINRVRQYLTESPSFADKARYGLYANTFAGLDTSTRIYEPVDGSWVRISNSDYRKPRQRVAASVLTGVAVGVGAGLLVNKISRALSHRRSA